MKISKDTKISKAGLKFICDFEAFEATAYLDELAKPPVYTIGFGSTLNPKGRRVTKGMTITKEDALRWVGEHLSKRVYPFILIRFKGLEVNQNQFDAICALVYNAGVESLSYKWAEAFADNLGDAKLFSRPIKLRILNSWMSVDKAGGKYRDGLERRRFAELYFFITGKSRYMVSGSWDEEKKLMNGNYEARTERALWDAWGIK